MKEVKVIAYSGYRGEEKPRFLFVDERKIEVEVLMEWREEDGYFYKVKGSDGNVYILKYDLNEEIWRLIR